MSYQAKITAKGQITLPADLRNKLGLVEGDSVEFYLDHLGRVMMRPRNRSAVSVLDVLDRHVADPAVATDDDAIAKAIIARDARSRTRKAKSR